MGQQTSSDSGPSTGTANQPATQPKKCYYELLSVSRTATQDEIKKAYRRKALELHPDRNYDNVDEATKLFTAVQTAYDVLSDPQERAWYDSHRDSILRGHDPGTTPSAVTTSEDVLSWFSLFSSRMPFSDSDPNGFYTVVRKAFYTLADEELSAARNEDLEEIHYPSFGSSSDTYENGHVREFYAAWTSFHTQKSFSWVDAYRYSDAPDRRVKRLMEAENRKAREKAIREFNDAVQAFAKFVRKRDPRYTPNTLSEKERLAAVRKASKEQAERQRKENAKKRAEYQAADWTKTENDKLDEEEVYEDDDEEDDEEEDKEEEIWECIVCKKIFRSQGQMDAHENSKKHVKAVQQLKRQMMKENKDFDLDRDVRGREKTRDEYTLMDDESDVEEDTGMTAADEIAAALEHVAKTKEPTDNVEQSDLEAEPTAPPKPQTPPADQASTEDEDEDDDEYTTAEKFQARVLELSEDLASSNVSDESTTPKIGKAKAKRAKRAQKAAAGEEKDSVSEFNCTTCKHEFPSKTKLFNHLKENPSHAKLVPKGGGAKKKKGRK